MDAKDGRNPFATPSRAGSLQSSQSRFSDWAPPAKARRFQSYLLTDEYPRPWVEDKRLKRTRVGNYIIWGFVVVALLLSGYYNYAETKKVAHYEVCVHLYMTS